jgi:hypothetical protein
MPNRSSRRKRPKKRAAPKRLQKEQDVNETAFGIAAKVIEEIDGKNPHAVALGRLGGLKGGAARAEKLTAKQRADIAMKAARARWGKTTG